MDSAPPRAAELTGAGAAPERPSKWSSLGKLWKDVWRLPSAPQPSFAWLVLAAYAGVLVIAYLESLPRGLFEDGYFLKRFAHNFWHHGSFSWNAADGPVYGMTSQSLQVVGTALYALADRYLVLTLKAVLYLSLLLTAVSMWRTLKGPLAPTLKGPALEGTAREVGLWSCVVGLASAPIVGVPLMGLETAMALCAVAVCVRQIVSRGVAVRDLVMMGASVLVLYLTRPDAALIPVVLLTGRAFLAWRDQRAASAPAPAWFSSEHVRLLGAVLGILVGLGALLLIFRWYYGTALPLPFYSKMHGLSIHPDEYIAHFAKEKNANALQALLVALPSVFIVLHERSRLALLLSLSGFAFGSYHYLATIEAMGHLSRFYLPGLVPILIAGGLAYQSYQQRRRWLVSSLFVASQTAAFFMLKRWDNLPPEMNVYVPAWIATAWTLLMPFRSNALGAGVAGVCLALGSFVVKPIESLKFEDDETIVRRQNRRRVVFAGLDRLGVFEPLTIFHTDMGAPGLLYPEARVVDIDGLLNEDITLRGKRFEELCRADRPEAIFVPNEGYQRLRAEVLGSECLKDYQAVSARRIEPLRVRKDLVARYHGRK